MLTTEVNHQVQDAPWAASPAEKSGGSLQGNKARWRHSRKDAKRSGKLRHLQGGCKDCFPEVCLRKPEEAGLNHFLLLHSNQSALGKELLVSPDKVLLLHGHLILLPYLIETTLNPSFSRLTSVSCFKQKDLQKMYAQYLITTHKYLKRQINFGMNCWSERLSTPKHRLTAGMPKI